MNSDKPDSKNKIPINRARNDFRRPKAMKPRKKIWINALFKTIIALAVLIALGIATLPYGMYALILIYAQHIYFGEVIGAEFNRGCGAGGSGWIQLCFESNYAIFAGTLAFDLLILYLIIFFILLIKEKYKN